MQPITADLARILKAKVEAGDDAFGGYVTVNGTQYPALRIELDKSERMGADQATIDLSNEGVVLGWGSTSVFTTNMQIEVWQWYGALANAVRTFSGLVDEIHDHRDFLVTTLTCRSRIALLVDQTFSTSAPQGADEAGNDRTRDNGVYLSMEISDIVTDLLDRAGWPTDDRSITATSMVIDEFDLADGESYRDAIVRLAAFCGYDLFDDEDGVIHFEPTPGSDIISVGADPVYTFRTGEDITALDDVTDQYELRTRIKARGTLVTQTIRDSWTELWRTSKIAEPVGIWYDPSASANIRVLDRASKKLVTLRQSDRVVLSSVYLGGVVAHPLGISGDPSDATVYYVLNAPWIDGGSGGNTVKKIRKSDNHVLATYSLPDGHISAIKVSAAYAYFTDLTTDKFYRRSKTDWSAVASYQHTYNAVAQTNPSGIMVDGTTLHLFWANGGTTARFLECAESDPTTITKVVKTAGTTLHGGEMDTTTHTECYGDSDSQGLVAKFSLVEASEDTRAVGVEIVDTDLEDALGTLAGTEDRVHDSHPGDAAHAWESRRETIDLTGITSEAQAAQAAQLWLAKLSRRRRVLDVGIIGNPAIQKNDLVRTEDDVTGLAKNWIVDTYRTLMAETYTGTLSLVEGGVANETVTEDDPAVEPDAPGAGVLWITADDQWSDIYVNGTPLNDASSLPSLQPGGGPLFPVPVPCGILVAGVNVVAVKITNNDFTNDWFHNPTGFRWVLEVDPAGYYSGWPHHSSYPSYLSPSGEARGYPPGADGHTEAEWRGCWTGLGGAEITPVVANTKVLKTAWRSGTLASEPADWFTAAFDDSAWDAATEVVGPWSGAHSPADGTYGVPTPDIDDLPFLASGSESDPELDGAVFLARTTFSL